MDDDDDGALERSVEDGTIDLTIDDDGDDDDGNSVDKSPIG